MSKRTFTMADVGLDAAPAEADSLQYLASARYYGVHRQRVPALANSYMAIKKSFTHPYGLDALCRLVVKSNNETTGELLRWEPLFTPAIVLGAAGSITSVAYDSYDEFRIRAVRVTGTAEAYRDVDGYRMPKYIWYLGNHAEYDAEFATEMVTYPQLIQSRHAGESLKPLGSSTDRGWSVAFVPQVLAYKDDILGVNTAMDIPCPWLKTTEENKNLTLRSPVLLFKKPYVAGADDQTEAAWDVFYTVLIEFRNADINKL